MRSYRLIFLLPIFCISSVSLFVTADILRTIRFASPLQSLTIWDPDVKEQASQNPRAKFLDKYAAGLKAETEARKKLEDNPWLDTSTTAVDGKNWAKQAATKERSKFRAEEKYIEQAFDEASEKFSTVNDDASEQPPKKGTNSNQYQFVGVINPATSISPITWYARKKPVHAKWSVRLIHANRNAIIKDLFNRGKVDIFCRYDNSGEIDPQTNIPIVNCKYEVVKRSWKNLWNFSPKHFFADSSGMYWRERRLRSGLYTDGQTVYEASYRYRDGRNGMHRVSTFRQYLASKGVDPSQKERIIKKLSTEAPDIVVESSKEK